METDSLRTIAADGAQIVYRRIGSGRPLLVLNGFAATIADWDPSFLDGLSSSNELILLNNRGTGGSTDDGQPFYIARLAADAARVIEALGLERASVMGWSMGGFIAQALALNYADRVDKLVLLSTDSGGIEADLASPDVWSELVDTSGTPNEQARRLLFLLFPTDVAEVFYREFGLHRGSVARAVISRPAEAASCGDGRMASQWRREPAARDRCAGANCYRDGGHRNSCFKWPETGKRNSWRLACSVPSRRPCLHGATSTSARRSHQQFPRSRWIGVPPDLTKSLQTPVFRYPLPWCSLGTSHRAVATLERLDRRSACPRPPAFADRLCVTFHVHFFQLFNTVSHNIARFFRCRFEQRPQKRQRKNAPVQFPPRRLHLDFPFTLTGSGVADGQANGNSEAECAENRWHRIFAQKIFRAVQCPARFLLRLVPRLAHLRGNFFCCSTELLTPR